MAKQTVNIGTTSNDRTGDSLRSAFNKINANFTELYTQLGINSDDDLNLGAFEFTGSTLTTTDSSAIVIDQAASITGDFTVGGDIVPNVNEEHSLGSSAKRFKDIYLSGSTIDLGGTTLSIVDGKLQVGGADVGATVSYNEITDTPTIPSALSDLTNDLSDLDNLNAGEGIPDLLTAYTDQSAVVDSLLNAGNYGGNLVAPSDYTFYDLVVARRAANPLIPQELEQATLLQLNAYNAWQAEIAADKATITVGDYAWDFKGDGNIDGLFEGTGPVSFNNDYFEDGFRGGFTTDKSILQIMGAEYLNGSDDGGGIIIAGGSARNGGNNGDVIIASGTGGADGTGIISLLSSYISTSGTWIGTQTMDIKGSVFGDDSTLLVDGVNGVIPTSVLQGDISNDIKSSDIVIETTTSPGSISLTQTGIGNISISGTAIDFNNSPIQNFILSTLSSGLTAPGSAVVAGDTAISFNFSMAPTALTVEQDAITIGNSVTVNGFVGDIKGSVFADDSTLLVDGVNGVIPGYEKIRPVDAANAPPFVDFPETLNPDTHSGMELISTPTGAPRLTLPDGSYNGQTYFVTQNYQGGSDVQITVTNYYNKATEAIETVTVTGAAQFVWTGTWWTKIG